MFKEIFGDAREVHLTQDEEVIQTLDEKSLRDAFGEAAAASCLLSALESDTLNSGGVVPW
jgi:hypothetical protein